MTPIKPGDLVMSVRLKPCCGKGQLGWTARVAAILPAGGQCKCCGVWIGEQPMLNLTDTAHPGAFRASRFLKIDPPAEQKTRETEKELSL